MAGLPLWRVGIFVRTLHPDILGFNFIWKPGDPVIAGTADFDMLDSAEFRSSPLAIVFGEGREVRHRIDDPEGRRFPFSTTCGPRASPTISRCRCCRPTARFTPRAGPPSGPTDFSDDQLSGLRSLMPPLARLVEITNQRRKASILLDTYVGSRAGERILGGQIRRGHTETMHAAIWLSDLRGFTALSDRLPAETVVDILNLYFDCQVPAIRNHGGEVLKFMGDGLLAVFPIAEAMATSTGSAAPCSKRRANPRQCGSDELSDRRSRRALPLRRRAACRQDTLRQYRRRQPARLHLYRPPPSISPRGWKRSPGACIAPSWRRKALPASATAAGAISANSRSRDLPRPNVSTGWRTKPQ